MNAAGGATARSADLVGEVVRVSFDDGARGAIHQLALRDSCPCARCRHPLSGQRLFETGEVVPTARIARLAVDQGALALVWADGHESRFEGAWLAAEAAAGERGERSPREVTLWGAELTEIRPTGAYAEVTSDPEALRRWLAAIAELGFALLTGAPSEEGTVAAVAELFGHVRETNYGRVFEVTVHADAANLADSALALSLHTDNPYRTPAPTLQLLHCLVPSASGGETVLADGFRAVSLLAAEAPTKLDLLASQPVHYSYRDTAAELTADVPVVSLDANGAPVALQLNNRSKGVPAGPPGRVADWYDAYFALLALLARPDAQVVFRLEPGDVIVFDNLRVLHGRRVFSGEQARRLQGCYADRDALLSTLAVLERGRA